MYANVADAGDFWPGGEDAGDSGPGTARVGDAWW